MIATTTARAVALSIAFVSAAQAQSADNQSAETPAPAAQTEEPARGTGAVPDPDSTTVEMKANAAGAAVATGAGAVAPGQTLGLTVPSLPGLDLEPSYMENGRWYNAEGLPTYKIEDGVVDYATFSGYRRYHSECHVCHGPDGEGSTYAPALKESVTERMDYYEFMEIAASGKQSVNAAANQVMPAFGTNRNAWCYIDDIYVYLLARGTDAVPRGRPANRADKSEEFTAQENSCMEG